MNDTHPPKLMPEVKADYPDDAEYYHGACDDCGQKFNGPKRARICYPCSKLMERYREQGEIAAKEYIEKNAPDEINVTLMVESDGESTSVIVDKVHYHSFPENIWTYVRADLASTPSPETALRDQLTEAENKNIELVEREYLRREELERQLDDEKEDRRLHERNLVRQAIDLQQKWLDQLDEIYTLHSVVRDLADAMQGVRHLMSCGPTDGEYMLTPEYRLLHDTMAKHTDTITRANDSKGAGG